MLAVAEHAGIQSEIIPRIATGFCSGMARTGGMCGAVSGGIMAISLIMGRNSPGETIDPCYQAVRLFLDKFSAQYKALSCLDLTGVHLGTAQGQAEFKQKGQIRQCTTYVSEATRMVLDVVGSN